MDLNINRKQYAGYIVPDTINHQKMVIKYLDDSSRFNEQINEFEEHQEEIKERIKRYNSGQINAR